jgi:hypothetical protein
MILDLEPSFFMLIREFDAEAASDALADSLKTDLALGGLLALILAGAPFCLNPDPSRILKARWIEPAPPSQLKPQLRVRGRSSRRKQAKSIAIAAKVITSFDEGGLSHRRGRDGH